VSGPRPDINDIRTLGHGRGTPNGARRVRGVSVRLTKSCALLLHDPVAAQVPPVTGTVLVVVHWPEQRSRADFHVTRTPRTASERYAVFMLGRADARLLRLQTSISSILRQPGATTAFSCAADKTWPRRVLGPNAPPHLSSSNVSPLKSIQLMPE